MDDLRQLFFRSFEQFAEREAENILHGTSERNLCARWAPLLEMAAVEAGYSGYRADTEYNRKQGGQVKTILDETMHVVRITCDLILHSYDDIWSADGRALPEHVCGYGLGYFVELDADGRRFRFEEYQRGRLSTQMDRAF